MKFRIFLFALLLTALIRPVQARITGYIAFDYIKGQADSDLSRGTFQNSLAGLLFFDDIASGLSYLTEIQFNAEGTFDLEQALISLGSSEGFGLKLGLYTVPFGRYNQFNRPHQTVLINPPLNVERMYPSLWKDVGVLIEGKVRGFFYSAYVGNGLRESEDLNLGQQFKDNNSDKGKGGRVGFQIGREIQVAYSHYSARYDDNNERNLRLQAVDLFWFTPDWQVQGEYSRARLENPGDPGEAEGYFIQILMTTGRIRPAVSYQYLDYEDSFHGPGFASPAIPGSGIAEKKRRWALALVYQASENLLLKFEYDWNLEKEGELKDNAYSLQAAFSF